MVCSSLITSYLIVCMTQNTHHKNTGLVSRSLTRCTIYGGEVVLGGVTSPDQGGDMISQLRCILIVALVTRRFGLVRTLVTLVVWWDFTSLHSHSHKQSFKCVTADFAHQIPNCRYCTEDFGNAPQSIVLVSLLVERERDGDDGLLDCPQSQAILICTSGNSHHSQAGLTR